MRWGFVPSWEKDLEHSRGIINARAESLAVKPAFKFSFQKRRCLVPADGFYEWLKKGKHNFPVRFVLSDESLFAFAGIWNADEQGSFAIITTSANKTVQPVHDRMPVILRKEQYAAWLSPTPLTESVAASLMQSIPAELLKCYDVDSIVNNVRIDSPLCIQKAREQEETGWLF